MCLYTYICIYIYNQQRELQEPSNQIGIAKKRARSNSCAGKEGESLSKGSGFVYTIQTYRRNKREQPRTWGRKSEERNGCVGSSGGGRWKAGAVGNTEGARGQRNKLSSAVMGKKAASTRSLRPRNPCSHSATWVRGTGGEKGGNSRVNTKLFSSETKIREEDGNVTSYALSRWKTLLPITQKNSYCLSYALTICPALF